MTAARFCLRLRPERDLAEHYDVPWRCCASAGWSRPPTGGVAQSAVWRAYREGNLIAYGFTLMVFLDRLEALPET